ncbi:DUF4232 domain-containing protein [Mycolicibacterium brisbanense]|uniref:DUF4232 domain-containing protein n=1 Tax=Mycolicibacterium brisbanense TaxID=146020 RepID=UPI000A0631DD|nr:DUF4232 domain-containing protein [Mycolicibacterium brisbanense]
MNRLLPLLTLVLIAGCSASPQNTPTPTSSTSSPSSESAATTTVASSPATSTPAPPASSATNVPAELGLCTDADLAIANGDVESADTMRRLAVSFKNTSTHPCTLVGYPGVDLVTAAGGVLVHVDRRPAAAAHRLTLNPGDTANADIQASAIDTASGKSCARIGTVVVTAPGIDVPHTLNAALPICSATVSSVD